MISGCIKGVSHDGLSSVMLQEPISVFLVSLAFNRASDNSWKKKSNFAGFLGTKSQKNWPISREYSGQTWLESNR